MREYTEEIYLPTAWLYHYSFRDKNDLFLPICHHEVAQTPVVDIFVHESRVIIVNNILDVVSWYQQNHRTCLATPINAAWLWSKYFLSPDRLLASAYPFSEMVP